MKQRLHVQFRGISLSLTPEEVDINDLVRVHASFTRVVAAAFQALDPEGLPGFCDEVIAALRAVREQQRGKR